MITGLNGVNIGDTISFELHPNGIFNNDFHNVKVIAVTSARYARNLGGQDVYALHAQVYRYLPQGTIEDNVESYSFIVIETADNVMYTLGIPWIRPESIKVVNQMTATFTVEGVNEVDIPFISKAIKNFGYNVTVKVSSTTVAS